MAVALRPAVLLIVFASVLFFAAGALDAASGVIDLSAIESWILGAINLLVAVFIARGNERMLALRIGLAAFFMIERPVTAVAFGPKPLESIGLHLVTAIVEGVILFSTLRIWRLGHSVSQSDLAFLSLAFDALPRNAGPREVALAANAALAGPVPSVVTAGLKRKERRERPAKAPRAEKPLDTRSRPTWGSALIGVLALVLALALLSDALVRGIVPGAAVDLASPDWLVYVFALVVLVVAARAVHQGRFAVRLLLAVTLIVLVERAFTPFALTDLDATSIGLKAAGALVALALALACAASLRATRPRTARGAIPL